MLSARGHMASLVTFSHEALAKRAPNVAFVHNFPGPVNSGIGRGATSPAMLLLRAIFTVIGPFINMSNLEAGDRHLFLATSARYASSTGTGEDAHSDGVPLADELRIARGSIGQDGSGVYTVDQLGESAGANVEETITRLRGEGVVEKFWKHTEDVYERITGLPMGID